MELKELIKGVSYSGIENYINHDITSVAYDSRQADKGSLFVCIDGVDDDGHNYLDSAISKGAVCAVVTKDVGKHDITVIKTNDAREALAIISSNFYKKPSEKMNVIGITGTKGKTTISYMLKSMYDYENRKCAVFGTLGNLIGERYIKTKTTTPQSLDLQRFFNEALEEGIQDTIMEVSSIALKHKRVYGTDYDIGIFTNISRAHIGKREHSDFDDYLNSKAILFKMCKTGIINIDDGYSSHITENSSCKLTTLSLKKDADITASDIKYQNDSSSFTYIGLGRKIPVTVSMPGEFNVNNAMYAITAALLSGISIESIIKGIKDVKVSGRCETVYKKDFTIVIDYAHTPDSLEKLLLSMRHSGSRIICLFGCGGDRDNKMRPMMGEISGKLADYTIITSDNPRTETPENIISMIEEGIIPTGGEYVCITDRTQAIRHAIENAKPNDLIILAGKGHETYIEKNGIRTHYDEREIVSDIMKEIEGGM